MNLALVWCCCVGGGGPGANVFNLLLEDGSNLLLEDGTSVLLLEA
jgi:hypothetical protein